MSAQTEADTISAVIAEFSAQPEMLVQILIEVQSRCGFLSTDARRQIAASLNISRADLHSVVSFYDDFRTEPAGRCVVRICQAEACQAMGSRELTAHAEAALGVNLHATAEDGSVTLEPSYCLGNCACSPAVMIGERVYGKVDAARFDALISTCVRDE